MSTAVMAHDIEQLPDTAWHGLAPGTTAPLTGLRGGHGDLLAPQTGDAPHAVDGQAHAVGLDELTPSPQVIAEQVVLAHIGQATGARRGQPVPVTPRIVRALPVSRGCLSVVSSC